MTKKEFICKFFHKAHLLTTNNKNYCLSLDALFRWLTTNDQVKSDQTTKILRFSGQKKAVIISRENSLLAGSEEITYLLSKFTQLSIKFTVKDGQQIKINQIIATVTGPIQEILSYERTIINTLQRLSGIASQTQKLVKIIPPDVWISATRKTPWGTIDKKAVAVGGGLTHRLNLKDGILIKDNHLKLTSIPLALKQIIPQIRHQLIEVEVKTLKEAFQSINVFTQLNKNNYLCIMFDNFSASKIKTAIIQLNKPAIIYEASGGINQTNLLTYAKTGVDIISLGALTHSCRATNLSLEIDL